MADTLRASEEGLKIVDQVRRRKGWTKTRTATWWDAAYTSQATLRRFWRGMSIQRESFIAICRAVGITDWQAITKQFEPTKQDSVEVTFPLSSEFQGQRTLAAIVFTDAVAFSAKMSANEEQTLRCINRDFQLIRDCCQSFAGKVLKSTGDGLLMYFTSAMQAVACALETQKSLAVAAQNLSPNEVLEHRIGIHLGDVFFSDSDVMGNGVNIAARLQTEAVAGGICISQTVYDVVKNSLSFPVNYLGEKELKNIAEAVPIYQIILNSEVEEKNTSSAPVVVNPTLKLTELQDWGEAPDISSFYGRSSELRQLEKWIVQENCKIVVLLGMGGIGKTALAVTLADQIQDQFDSLIWKSLLSVPPLLTLLKSLIGFLSQGEETLSSNNIQEGISLLIHYLQKQRCLIVLDEIETIFQSRKGKPLRSSGQYQEGYEDYGELFKRISCDRHQSCILLTSRDKPAEIAVNEGKTSPVRSLQLQGLQLEDAQDIFKAKGFSSSEQGLTELISLYGGNPLALKVITTMIQEVFNGDVTNFLSQNTIVLGDRLRSLLQKQVNHLSDLEKEVLYWLTIEGEPLSLAKLQADLLFPPSPSQLLEILVSLERRSLIDKITEENEILFNLQPLVMKYLTEEFIEQVLDEIDAVLETQDIQKFKVFKNHALTKPQGSKSRRKWQYNPRILKKFINSLRMMFRCDDISIGEELRNILPLLKGQSSLRLGYIGYNLYSIFQSLDINLDDYDWEDISLIDN